MFLTLPAPSDVPEPRIHTRGLPRGGSGTWAEQQERGRPRACTAREAGGGPLHSCSELTWETASLLWPLSRPVAAYLCFAFRCLQRPARVSLGSRLESLNRNARKRGYLSIGW